MGKGIFYFSLKKNLRAISSSPLFTLFTLKGVTKSIFPPTFHERNDFHAIIFTLETHEHGCAKITTPFDFGEFPL